MCTTNHFYNKKLDFYHENATLKFDSPSELDVLRFLPPLMRILRFLNVVATSTSASDILQNYTLFLHYNSLIIPLIRLVKIKEYI